MATIRRPRIGGIVLVFRARLADAEPNADAGVEPQAFESFCKERLECIQ